MAEISGALRFSTTVDPGFFKVGNELGEKRGWGEGFFGIAESTRHVQKLLLFENWSRQLKTVTPEILEMPQNYVEAPVQRGLPLSLS